MFKVIVIDDEPWSREVVKALIPWELLELQLMGEAEDGNSGLRLAEELSPHIVITDMRMPGIDGVELLRQFNERYPEIKIIVMSGYDDFMYLKQAIRSRAVEYLLKPIDPDELEAALSRCIKELEDASLQGEQVDREPFFFDNRALLDRYLSVRRQVYGYMQELNFTAVKQTFWNLKEQLMEVLTEEQQRHILHKLGHDFILILQEFIAENGLDIAYVRDQFDARITEWSSIQQAMVELNVLYEKTIKAVEEHRKNRGRLSIADIQAYIDKHYGESISLETIAQHFYVSKEHLCRLFKASAGENLTDYLIRKRMERAKELITEQGFSIKNSAEMIGYSDIAYFYRVFKKHFGMTPGDMRKED
jgi:two-component system response regulator YesN